jgi:DNA topoisomerase-3
VSKTLIICEKPSVAADVAKALYGNRAKKTGDHYESDEAIVAFAVGHLVEQVDPDAYDQRYKTWRYEDLPIIPEDFRYHARDARSQKQLKSLHQLMARADVTEIVNACDAGREGELIFKLILQTAPAKARGKPVRRAWFSSMTAQAIRDAFDRLRDDEAMRPLEQAARARSEADWLVGMNATRAATTRAGSVRKVLSLGRVQTPTLALIAHRDLEIAAFVPEDYWEVEARFDAQAGAYTGMWHEGSKTRLGSAEAAEAIATAAGGASGVVEKVETSPQTEHAPLLYDLTTLQREANNRFGFSASRTLSAAQALYDQHKLLTYPRTNSRYLSGDMVGQLRPTLSVVGAADDDYARPAEQALSLEKLPLNRIVNDAKVGDHHAIIPTDARPNLSALGRDERRLYDLVARRFMAVFLPAARFERTVVETRVGEHLFRSRGRVMLDAGWRAAYGERADAPGRESAAAKEQSEGKSDGEGKGEEDRRLPPLREGDAVTCASAEALAKQTRPPGHFSDASLLRAMETAGKLVDDDEAAEAMKDAGLGTPATRAATIERLVDAGYVEREGRQLRATDKGIGLINMLGDHVLTSPTLTGRWEQRLNRIERGEERDADFKHEIEGFTREVVGWFADKDRDDVRIKRTPIAPCPMPGCEGEIVEYPKSYGCTSYHGKDDPGCGYTLWKQHAGKTLTREEALEHIAAGRQSSDLDAQREVLGPCPTEGCGGEIIERGRSYGCTSWKSRKEPGCGYVIWKKVRGQKGEVDIETAKQMVAKGETNATPAPDREPLAACPTPGCKGEIIERGRSFGCTSWKSRKNPGCGYVIWKTSKGVTVSREEAVTRIEEDRTRLAAEAAAESNGEAGGDSEKPKPKPKRRRKVASPTG